MENWESWWCGLWKVSGERLRLSFEPELNW